MKLNQFVIKVFAVAAFLLVFSASLSKAEAQEVTTFNQKYELNADGTITLTFNLEIEDGWYMYGTKKIKMGPSPTAIEFEQSSDFELVGALTERKKAKVKFDEGFGLEVEIFEVEASFSQIIKPLTSEPFIISGFLSYQTCNGTECLLNENEVSLEIRPAKASGNKENKNSDQGLFIFLLIAFAAGLGGVITPCVFPMIPMTVGFLINSDGNKRAGRIKGLIFGLSVMLIYTLLGVIVSVFQSTSTTDILGTHWVPNLIFTLMFFIFAISFFGAFEITLPSGLANKADQKADKGGYIAAFFVALAMVIVSFSCTGPFVGSILAAAVSGGFSLKPILGMAVFGLAFSLPFVLFSFFPGIMKKLPKSGNWLNMVKVVFAFVLLAFGFKYLYNIDAYFGWGILTRLGFLSIWIVLAILLGLYFLGKIRTHHDGEVQTLGWGRLMAGIASLTFAVYMIPGLFGAPLSSISGLIPPPDGSTLNITGGNTAIISEDPASPGMGYCGPAKYAGSHKPPYGLKSYYEIEQAIECSKQTNKPILLAFKSNTCSVCKVMEANVWSNNEVLSILNNDVILVSLYVDDKTNLPDNEWVTSSIDGKVKKTLGRKLRDYQLSKFNSASQPLYAIIDSNENILAGPVASVSVEEYLNFLRNGIKAFEK